MKTWHWIALGLGIVALVVLLYFIFRTPTKTDETVVVQEPEDNINTVLSAISTGMFGWLSEKDKSKTEEPK